MVALSTMALLVYILVVFTASWFVAALVHIDSKPPTGYSCVLLAVVGIVGMILTYPSLLALASCTFASVFLGIAAAAFTKR